MMRTRNLAWLGVVVIAVGLSGGCEVASEAAPEADVAEVPADTEGVDDTSGDSLDASEVADTSDGEAEDGETAIEPPDRNLNRYYIEPGMWEFATCNDGSIPDFYFRRGVGDGADKWVLWFEGGGTCYSLETCTARWADEKGKMTSEGNPEVSPRGDGILSIDPAQNPDFADWNHVILEYCSSDAWTGQRESSPFAGVFGGDVDGELVFRGAHIASAILGTLETDVDRLGVSIEDASRILVTGSSAGGTGMRAHVDRIASRYAAVDVRGISDATVPVVVTPEGMDEGSVRTSTKVEAWEALLDDSCVAANPDQPQRCLDGVFLVREGHLETDIFFHMDQLDPKAALANRISQTPPDALAFEASAQQTRALLAGKPAFVPARGNHTILTSTRFGGRDDDGSDYRVGGDSMADLVHRWYVGEEGATHADELVEGEGCVKSVPPHASEVSITTLPEMYAHDLNAALADEAVCLPAPSGETMCTTGNPFVDKPHVVMVPTAGVELKPYLFVFLGGTGGGCGNHQNITRMAAHAGFRSICLGYINDPSIGDYCATDPDEAGCRSGVREELVYGVDGSDKLTVGPHNAIVGRLKALLLHLANIDPAQGFQDYLAESPDALAGVELDWSRIVIAGYSQGGGHAGIIARDHLVARAVFISKGAGQESELLGPSCAPDTPCAEGLCNPDIGMCAHIAPATWATTPQATPAHRRFGIVHTLEFAWNYTPAVFATWRMDAWGDWVDADTVELPYGCTRQLSTSVEPPEGAGYHGSMGGDGAMAVDDTGLPANRRAYMYLMNAGW